MTHILLITGAAGVGKSTLCWEIGAQLAADSIPHAIIESDELDRVFPKPDAGALASLWSGASDVSEVSLRALWSTYRTLGHTRLIMSGVMMHVAFDKRWIVAAIPDADITVVRLVASDATLIERLDKREIGSGRDEQIARTLRQAKRIAGEAANKAIIVLTDGKRPAELAADVIARVPWLRADVQA
jgi:hypothetical protein